MPPTEICTSSQKERRPTQRRITLWVMVVPSNSGIQCRRLCGFEVEERCEGLVSRCEGDLSRYQFTLRVLGRVM